MNKIKDSYVEEYVKIREFMECIINSTTEPIFVKDQKHRWILFNDAFCCFIGKNRNELFEKSDYDCFPKEEADVFWEKDDVVFTSGVENINEEIITDTQGVFHTIVTKKTLFTDEKGEKFIVGAIRDITDQKQMEEQLKHLSLHDSLTQLHNRAFFEEQVKHMNWMSGMSAGLLVCDVDGLKEVNDTLGHRRGDVILQAVAEILKDTFQSRGSVARIGGDEFAVLLHTNSLKELTDGCHRLRKRIDCYNEENPTVPISLSIGYAVSKKTPTDMDALMKEADNNMHREKLHRQKSNRSAIVQALMKALEVRDYLTEGHGDRLQTLIQSFATSSGRPESSMADLRLFAHFHDIGKVGISDAILFKPGPLTGEERETMQKHCEIGYRIAMSAHDLIPIADWILKHQEWWNGGGYPLGLKEKDIPIECRMLAIVDAYDAMTSDRPYRKGMSHEAAAAELRRCAGTQFDPELVQKFLSKENMKGRQRN